MRLATLIFLSVFVFISCGKGDDVKKEGNCLTAVINGEAFTATLTQGNSYDITVDFDSLGTTETRSLTIFGTITSLSSSETITLTFACAEFTSDLDYAESESGCGIGMDYNHANHSNPDETIVVAATEGQIHVEDLTTDHIRGTFTFKGKDQNGKEYEITDGFFDTTIE